MAGLFEVQTLVSESYLVIGTLSLSKSSSNLSHSGLYWRSTTQPCARVVFDAQTDVEFPCKIG